MLQNIGFYCLTVLIWGSTWIAITFQLGAVDPVASVAWRFALAAGVLLVFCRLTGRNLRFRPAEHGFMALQGLFLFGVNYWMFYLSELYIASGLAAVIFSTMVVMNVVNGAIFLKTPVDGNVLWGAALGLTGMVLVFWPELSAFHFSDEGFRGVLFALAGTWLASVGNILSARNQKSGLPVIETNAFGMAYGAGAMFLVAAGLDIPLTFTVTPTYFAALCYLAIFGSVVAFGCYLTLVGNLGPGRAAYATLLFPVVALLLSTVFEGYQWTAWAGCGVGLILTGNLLMLKRKPVQTASCKTEGHAGLAA